MLTQLKALLALAVLLAVIGIAGAIYWRGSSNATTKNDLRIARETIKVEREALKITHTIDMRVNAEGIQTAQTAKGAASEIEAIRLHARKRVTAGRADNSCADDRLRDTDAARVLQLAREARAAAVASSARLQSTGTGTR